MASTAGTLVDALPDAWRCRVCAWTGWFGVSVLTGRGCKLALQLLSVTTRKIVQADLSPWCTLCVAEI